MSPKRRQATKSIDRLIFDCAFSFDRYRPLASPPEAREHQRSWFDEAATLSTTRAIVERRPITPSDEETSFA